MKQAITFITVLIICFYLFLLNISKKEYYLEITKIHFISLLILNGGILACYCIIFFIQKMFNGNDNK